MTHILVATRCARAVWHRGGAGLLPPCCKLRMRVDSNVLAKPFTCSVPEDIKSKPFVDYTDIIGPSLNASVDILNIS